MTQESGQEDFDGLASLSQELWVQIAKPLLGWVVGDCVLVFQIILHLFLKLTNPRVPISNVEHDVRSFYPDLDQVVCELPDYIVLHNTNSVLNVLDITIFLHLN